MNAPLEDISKFLEGSLDAKKSDVLMQWREESPENETYFQELKYVWNSSSDTIKQDGEIISVNTEVALAKVHSKIEMAKVVNLKPRFNFLAIASTLILLIGFVFLFQYLNEKTNIIEVYASTETGQQVTLPDASTIWLEPGSKVSYVPTFSSGRKITIEGEIYVDVIRNKESPFTVTSPNLTVDVLGTSFVVKDDDQLKSAHVTVLTGKVRVTASKTKKEVILTKDMTAVYDEFSTELKIAESVKTINHLYTATKQLRFSETTLRELFDQLEALTNTTIELKNSTLLNCPFTGQFNTNRIDKILQRIQPIYNFTIQSDSGKYSISEGSCN